LLALTLSLEACTDGPANAQAAQQEPYAQKLAKAKALFAERCKTAGVVIKRTVKDVEGIELAKIRPKLEYADRRYFDPMFEGAAMAGEVSGSHYIRQFLLSEFRYNYAPTNRGELSPPDSGIGYQQLSPTSGYRFVEVRPTGGENRYRYRLAPEGQGVAEEAYLQKEAVSSPATRYAVDYEDLVEPRDRAY
jgi:hypothetical protein